MVHSNFILSKLFILTNATSSLLELEYPNENILLILRLGFQPQFHSPLCLCLIFFLLLVEREQPRYEINNSRNHSTTKTKHKRTSTVPWNDFWTHLCEFCLTLINVCAKSILWCTYEVNIVRSHHELKSRLHTLPSVCAWPNLLQLCKLKESFDFSPNFEVSVHIFQYSRLGSRTVAEVFLKISTLCSGCWSAVRGLHAVVFNSLYLFQVIQATPHSPKPFCIDTASVCILTVTLA